MFVCFRQVAIYRVYQRAVIVHEAEYSVIFQKHDAEDRLHIIFIYKK